MSDNLVAAFRRLVVPLNILCFVLGIVWICLFPLVCITTGELKCRGTYFSENALLPGSATPRFSAAHLKAVDAATTVDQDIVGLLQSLTVQNQRVYEGDGVVYSITRPVPAGDRKEAVVLCALFDYDGDWAAQQGGRRSSNPRLPAQVQMALALNNLLADASWLSKNVIVLVARDHLALRKWLHDYHNSPLAQIHRAGSIRGAVVLDWAAQNDPPKPGHPAVTFKLAGVNGQLPNLDLFNTAHRIARLIRLSGDLDATRESHKPSMQDTGSLALHNLFDAIKRALPGDLRTSLRVYLGRMQNLLHFMHQVAFGPSGAHAMFVQYDIDAITVSALLDGTRSQRFGVSVGQLVEGIVHSLSNISEKLHQSYYLYLLPDNDLFVSIGEYTGSLLLILAPLAFTTIRLVMFRPAKIGRDVCSYVIASLLVFLMAMAVGVALFVVGGDMVGPALEGNVGFNSEPLLQVGNAILDNLGDAVPAEVSRVAASATLFPVLCWLALYVTVSVAVSLVGFPLVRSAACAITGTTSEDLVAGSWPLLKAATLFYVFLAHGILGMVCYPFAVFSALVNVPIYTVMAPTRSRLWRFVLVSLILATSLPIQALVLRTLVVNESYWVAGLSGDVDELLRGETPLEQLVAAQFVMMNGYATVSTFHYVYLCLLHIPCHLLGFQLAWMEARVD